MNNPGKPEEDRPASSATRRPLLMARWTPGLKLHGEGEHVAELQDYLRRFGYLEPRSGDMQSAWRARWDARRPHARHRYFDEATQYALKQYQRFHQLPATGFLDEVTLLQMSVPRCGVPDWPVLRPSGGAQPIFAVFRSKWQKTNLTFGFGEATPDLPMNDVRAAIVQAFSLWSSATPLRFTEAAAGATPDILIRFVVGDHGDGDPFDGQFGTLAHAFPPPFLPGGTTTVCFDDAETWRTVFSLYGWSFDFDLVSVAAHEIGHALGLDHSDQMGALMRPTTPPGLGQRYLSADDIRGIQSLYLQTFAEQLHVCAVMDSGEAWLAKRIRQWWTPFDDLKPMAGDPGPVASSACANVADEFHVCAALSNGGLMHAVRHATGWDTFGDVTLAASNPGRIRAVSVAAVANELHVCVVTVDGNLWHSIRHATSWEPFRDVKAAASNPGFVTDVAIAEVAGELHVCALTYDGMLWHSIRHGATWDVFGDVKAAASDPGRIIDVGAASLAGELHVCAVTSDSMLWHTIRHATSPWDAFGDVKAAAASDPGNIAQVACAADLLGDLQVICLTGTGAWFWADTHLWHSIRHLTGTWDTFTDVEPLTSDPGRLFAISAAAMYEYATVAPVNVTTRPA